MITHYSKKNLIQKRIGLHRPRPLPISAIKASKLIIYHLKISTFLIKNHARQNRIPILSNHPPAEPGAFVHEPLKAAYRGR